MSSTSSFSLQPVTEDDIPVLTEIFSASFKKDTNTQLKLVGKDPNSQADGMAGGIRQWLCYPDRISVLKAVDNSTGTIMGWTGWGCRGYEASPAQPTPETVKEERPQVQDTEENKPKTIEDPVERLEALTNADMTRWMAKIMPPGTKCRYLHSCVVHPSYQSRGVGLALIRWGTEKADKDGVFCWVHSSDGGQFAFQKAGFEEIERLEVDLDEFATAPRKGVEGMEDGKWGKYVFRYMVRQPRES
jgi:hypothetical protein